MGPWTLEAYVLKRGTHPDEANLSLVDSTHKKVIFQHMALACGKNSPPMKL